MQRVTRRVRVPNFADMVNKLYVMCVRVYFDKYFYFAEPSIGHSQLATRMGGRNYRLRKDLDTRQYLQ